jgi:hypothetical protein
VFCSAHTERCDLSRETFQPRCLAVRSDPACHHRLIVQGRRNEWATPDRTNTRRRNSPVTGSTFKTGWNIFREVRAHQLVGARKVNTRVTEH